MQAIEGEDPTVGPIPLKYIVLILLVVQNSLTAILARASRTPPAGGGLYRCADSSDDVPMESPSESPSPSSSSSSEPPEE